MRVIIVGADGKMGQSLLWALERRSDIEPVAAIVPPTSPWCGKNISELSASKAFDLIFETDLKAVAQQRGAQAVIDFTRPQASVNYAKICAEIGLSHIIGTTGFSFEEQSALEHYSQHMVMVKSGNMSLGVNLLAALVRQAAQILDMDFDIEISEMHHRHKVDAPSGTALLLAKAAAEGRQIDLAANSITDYSKLKGPRPAGAIGFSVQRGGNVIGEHHVTFAGESERLVLSHLAQDRTIFAQGALKAALWSQGKEKGLYDMLDVLELDKKMSR